MNGGSFGAVGSVYKGNYFAGITTSAGVHAGTASARPNDYDVFIVAGGVAAKTGYNLEIKKGSVIVQPSLGVSYTFVNSFDYNTAIGKVRPNPLSAIQIEPTVKLVWNWKNKWQPYAMFSADWNIMDRC